MARINYRILTFDDVDEIRDIVCKHLFVQDTMCKAISIDADKAGNAFADVMFQKSLADGVSLGAFDSETGQMVGIRLSGIIHKNNQNEDLFPIDDPKTREIALMMEPVKILYDALNLFEKYGVEKLVSFRGLCVVEQYQHQGIGTALVEMTMEVMKDKGIQLVTGESSSRFSKRIFEKTGFDTLGSLPYTDVKYDGTPVTMTEDLILNKGVTLFVKMLK